MSSLTGEYCIPNLVVEPYHPTIVRRRIDEADRIPIPVVLDIPRRVAVEILFVAARVGDLNAARSPIRIPVATEIEDVEAGGSVPGLTHQPVGAVLVGLIALASWPVRSD